MLLALVLAVAPVTISLTPDKVTVDAEVIATSFQGDFLDLPEVNQALRKLRDGGSLDVRIEVVGAVRFVRLKRVLFASASAGARALHVSLEGVEPFETVIGAGAQARSLGVIRVAPTGIWVDELRLPSDGGVVDVARLAERLQAPRPDGVVTIAVDDTVLTSALAPLVETCRRRGYQLALTPLSVGSSSVKSSGAPPPGVPGVDKAMAFMGAVDKEPIRKVIHANRKAVGACYDKLLATKRDAAGKVLVRFVVSAVGEVESAKVEENTVGDDELAQCVTGALKTWVFPKPAGGGVVIISYPFIFKTAPSTAR